MTDCWKDRGERGVRSPLFVAVQAAGSYGISVSSGRPLPKRWLS
ncbi:hypothetical protein GSU1080 [Geobacter sulfurreducens PCA]|uniref:Uncharacterized protein n=1 Tax=Geobacter sulfurreducens (strain ATCC 51573 / DSM 12127 / PCA) TaxID=243231 RepID=Q74E84_GEOSL|nr:hypothetical protein GSU1080 [Geobacter sulfurreducens PCA]ADN78333.1 hypothetical protein KN400_3436 [Geobacter sulfurreducens KN400]AJY70801.1 hypothetical protein RW64_15055 [Geobacter sulfurreducens]HBB69737.1 hypothetical protein [Geobacter sulfurreducens]HCD95625.1 hypothetical protein [Geobacter sulfurreducens]